MTANTHEKILEVRGLTKTYGGVKKKGAKQPTPTLDVLKGIDIEIQPGEVVAIVVPRDKRGPIMDAVNTAHGLRQEAQTILCALPIDHIVRLG